MQSQLYMSVKTISLLTLYGTWVYPKLLFLLHIREEHPLYFILWNSFILCVTNCHSFGLTNALVQTLYFIHLLHKQNNTN